MYKQMGFCLGFGVLSLAALAVCGCGQPPVKPMEIAPNAGAQAVAQLDANKDGALDYNELAKAPGLRAAVAKIKKLVKSRRSIPSESEVRSAKITADEIDARIQEWKEHSTGRVFATCRVTRRGIPIANAEIKFVPESFLGPGLSIGTGTTDASGYALVSQPSRGAGDPAKGVGPGFYRVEITKGNEIPAKYNKATILGQEVAGDALGISTGGIVFDLSY